METPQYLRKALIGMHPELRYAGMLPPLDAPHHLRASEWGEYREGVVRFTDAESGQSFVDVGLEADALVKQAVREGARVTLHMGERATQVSALGKQAYLAELSTPAGERCFFSFRAVGGDCCTSNQLINALSPPSPN